MREVLLEGYLDSSRLKLAEKEIGAAVLAGEKLVILSVRSDSGDALQTLELIAKIKEWEKSGLFVAVKILLAGSAAALLAMSVGSCRAMDGRMPIKLHRGELHLDASDFDHKTGVISEGVMRLVRQYDKQLHELLERYDTANDPKLMAELFGSGWLELDAETCLKLGIVDWVL